jgi:hypothetical protein
MRRRQGNEPALLGTSDSVDETFTKHGMRRQRVHDSLEKFRTMRFVNRLRSSGDDCALGIA